MTSSARTHPKTARKVLVVGAGLGGLAAAIRLARAGFQVEVWEKNGEPGGKLKELQMDGFSWGTGPSLLTMPHVLCELFVDAGERMEEHLDLVRLDSACRYFWTDGTVIDEDAAFWARPEVARFLDYARGIYELSGEAYLNRPPSEFWRAFTLRNLGKLRHLGKVATLRSMAAEVERRISDPYLRQIFLRFATYNGSSPYLTPATFNIIPYVEAEFGAWYVRGGMVKIVEALAGLAERNGVIFRFNTTAIDWDGNEATAQDGSRTKADFLICNGDVLSASGSRCAPRNGARSVVFGQGPLRGAQRLPETVFPPRSQVSLGNAPVGGNFVAPSLRGMDTSNSMATSNRTTGRSSLHGGFLSGILGEKEKEKILNQPLSTSGFILFLGVQGRNPRLAHHNIFFSDDYPKEFDEIHRQKISSTEPTIYISISSRTDPTHAPEGCDNYFVLVNAPARDPQVGWTETEARAYRDVVIQQLQRFGIGLSSEVAAAVPSGGAVGSRRSQVSLGNARVSGNFVALPPRGPAAATSGERLPTEGNIVSEKIFTPSDFATRDLAYHGSLYGWASHSIRTSLFRPSLRAAGARNVFFVGGTTHPGGGIPLVLLSGKMVAEMIQREGS